MNTRRHILAGFTAAIMAATAGLGLITDKAAAADSIKVGEINSYTRLPAFTIPYRNGWQLALEQANKAGGIKGAQLEVISRDDTGDPATAVRIAQEMVSKDQVSLLFGTFFSHIGLAVSDFAKHRKTLFIAAEPLTDALVWSKGNDYTYRLRPSTHMQAAMLAKQAAKLGKKKWATIAPNYAYGKDAVKAFKAELTKLQPDVEWVTEQWPTLFKIDAGSTVRALEAAKPDAIYNVTFGGDLAKFVREGSLRYLFDGREVVSILTGEPEYLLPLGKEAPKDWIVTGYPVTQIKTEAHEAFSTAYQAKFGELPKAGALVGYNAMLSVIEVLKQAKSTKTEDLLAAMDGLKVEAPSGAFFYRAGDHQATMGAYVGKTGFQNGKPTMIDWSYADGADFLPSEEEAKKLRP